MELFPPIGICLVGEQSNAHRILLRYDRKSRHRRIKKQRRYERLAATSQFRYTDDLRQQVARPFLSPACRPVDGRTLSGGRSPYLRPTLMDEPTPLRALNRSAMTESGSQVGCGSSLFSELLPIRLQTDSATGVLSP